MGRMVGTYQMGTGGTEDYSMLRNIIYLTLVGTYVVFWVNPYLRYLPSGIFTQGTLFTYLVT